jgi:hypothetical protein
VGIPIQNCGSQFFATLRVGDRPAASPRVSFARGAVCGSTMWERFPWRNDEPKQQVKPPARAARVPREGVCSASKATASEFVVRTRLPRNMRESHQH